MNLNAGRVLDREKWTETPMTDEIINGVHELADDEDEEFIFWDCNGDDIPDDEIPCDDVPVTGVLDSGCCMNSMVSQVVS